MSEKPDCTECSPVWDRSNNFKGVIFCTKHDALTAENADLKKRVEELERQIHAARNFWADSKRDPERGGLTMNGCEICGRTSCARWMHSLEAQEEFDKQQSQG